MFLILCSGSSERPMTTSLSPNFLCSAFNSGIALRHGPHHVAQKSISTNLPLQSGARVSHFSASNFGAFWLRNELAQIFFSAPSAQKAEAVVTKQARARIVFINGPLLRPEWAFPPGSKVVRVGFLLHSHH